MSSVKSLDLNKIRWNNIGTEPSTERKDDGRDQFNRVPAEEYNWYRNKMDTFITAVVNAIRNSFSADLNAYYGNTKLGDDMQDETAWTVGAGTTQSADSTNVKIGNYSLKLLEPDNTGSAMISALNGITLDLTILNNGEASTDNDYIYLAYYVSDSSLVSSVQLIFDQDTPYTGTNIKVLTIVSGITTGWNYVKALKSDFTTSGGGAFDNIQSIRIRWISEDNAQNEYVSFQLIQLVKKDAVTTIPNPFQRFEVNDFEINSGEWFVGKEFNKIVIKELLGSVDTDALISTREYTDFKAILKFKISEVTSSQGGYLTMFEDVSNNIRLEVNGDNFRVVLIEGGSTVYDISIPMAVNSDSTVEFLLEKDGSNIRAVAYVDSDYSNPFEQLTTTILTSLKFALGVKIEEQYYESASITELAHAHHSYISEVAKDVVNTWLDYIPTLTFTGTPPASITIVARYRQLGNKVDFNISLSSADGNGATGLRLSLPITPRDNNSVISANSQEKVDTTWSNPLAYIDDDTGLGVQFRNFSTATDAVAWEMIITGSYEV